MDSNPNHRDTKPVILTDLKTFEQIYRQYWAELFDCAYQRVRSAEKAEEIIQDLFVTLWEKREQLEIKESVAGYLYTALKFRILNHLRDEKVRVAHLSHIKTELSVFSNALEEQVFVQELEKAYQNEVNNLPVKCRQAFVLSRNENLSFKEIASRLNISVNTVEKHVGKALKILRLNLKDYTFLLLFLFIEL